MGDAGNDSEKLFPATNEKELHIWVGYDDYPIAINEPRAIGRIRAALEGRAAPSGNDSKDWFGRGGLAG